MTFPPPFLRIVIIFFPRRISMVWNGNSVIKSSLLVLISFFWFSTEVFYSVMQSDCNSFCGDVVFDTFNKASRNEENILDQMYISKYLRIISYGTLILYNIIRKCTLILQVSCLFVLYSSKYAFPSITSKIQNLHY